MCGGMVVYIIVDLSVSEGVTSRATTRTVSGSATKVATRAVPNMLMYKNQAVHDIKSDFDKMLKNDCKCVNEEFKDVRKTFLNRVGYSILRLFAPLL